MRLTPHTIVAREQLADEVYRIKVRAPLIADEYCPGQFVIVLLDTERGERIPLTIVSLNTIMVDGIGMCGGCRVTVGGEAKFVCVDGPEFDGHLVDFDNMIARLGTYREQELQAHERYHHEKMRAA